MMPTELQVEVAAGSVGRWSWVDAKGSRMRCSTVVSELRVGFLGLRGVCVSWDSGTLDPAAAGLAGWQLRAGHAVSPVVDEALAASWPASSCGFGFDEWYFFAEVPDLEPLGALCNWSLSPGEASGLRDVPSGFDLEAQIERWQPEAIIGDGHRTFLISRHRALLEGFRELCGRRRTRG